MEFWGISAEEYREWQTVEVWPENESAVGVFIAMMTQWRTAGFGATGLDYAALPVVMRMRKVPRDEWPEVFEQVRLMEDSALIEMSKQAQKDRQRGSRG